MIAADDGARKWLALECVVCSSAVLILPESLDRDLAELARHSSTCSAPADSREFLVRPATPAEAFSAEFFASPKDRR